MSDTLCPRCNAKGTVTVRHSRTDKGKDLKYFQCEKCKSLWTNSVDIAPLAPES